MKEYGIRNMVLHYQPIVYIPTGEIAMYECLARFIDQNGGGISPTDINHLFDEPSFLWDIFERTFPSILQYAEKEITLSINVDVSSLTDKFYYFLEDFFGKHKNIAEFIHFEVTEKNIAKGLGSLPGHIEAIKKFGAKVVLDDFGTGGANIECLVKANFDIIKIDGIFMRNSVTNLASYTQLDRIIQLIRSYDYHVPIIGEHIENEAIETVAKRLGIEYGQGHLYGMPTPTIIEDDCFYEKYKIQGI